MKVLMSIKPEFATLIFEGKKGFEYRKRLFKAPGIKTIVVYASAPVSKVIGEFGIAEILSMKPTKLWSETKDLAGISKGYFTEYFGNNVIGHAIKIKAPKLYKYPRCIKEAYGLTPPQSFVYIKTLRTIIT